MHKALETKIKKLIEEEAKSAVDQELLDLLRALAADTDKVYPTLSPEKRNALNEFFKEIKNITLQQIIAGDYGASIILDAMIVLAFEVGVGISADLITNSRS